MVVNGLVCAGASPPSATYKQHLRYNINDHYTTKSINDHYTTKNITRPKQLKPLLLYINVLFFTTPHSITI